MLCFFFLSTSVYTTPISYSPCVNFFKMKRRIWSDIKAVAQNIFISIFLKQKGEKIHKHTDSESARTIVNVSPCLGQWGSMLFERAHFILSFFHIVPWCCQFVSRCYFSSKSHREASRFVRIHYVPKPAIP